MLKSLQCCVCIWITRKMTALYGVGIFGIITLLLQNGYFVTSTLNIANRLHTELLKKYMSAVRPLRNQSEAVPIRIRPHLMFIHGLEERNQQFSFSAWFDVDWQDENLQWNESDYPGVNHIYLPISSVWAPDITVTNSIREISMLTSEESLVRVTHDGSVLWTPGQTFKTYCQVDVTYYPFDTQACNVTIATWMSKDSEISIVPFPVNTADFQENIEWKLHSSQAYKLNRHYEQGWEGVIPSAVFVFVLSRRVTFYILNVILPVLMFAFLNTIGFILPSESGEKVMVSASIFLSFSFFMSLLNDSMPRTSSSTSIIEIYMLVVLSMGAASVCLSAISVWSHKKASTCRDVRQVEQTTTSRKRKLDELKPNGRGRSAHEASSSSIEYESESGRNLHLPRSNTLLSKRRRLAECYDKALLQGSLILTVFGAVTFILLLITS